MISEARKGKAILGMVCLVLAGALAGSPVAIGVHEECNDDINNEGGNLMFSDGIDLDGGITGDPFRIGLGGVDPDCASYPWADGNGESHTPMLERFLGDKYESTTFEIWQQYLGNGCLPVQLYGIEPPNDGSQQQYQAQCLPGPP